MPKKSILEPYFLEIYNFRQQGKSDQDIASILNKKYSLKIWKNQVYSFLKTKEKKGIVPPSPTEFELIKKLLKPSDKLQKSIKEKLHKYDNETYKNIVNNKEDKADDNLEKFKNNSDFFN